VQGAAVRESHITETLSALVVNQGVVVHIDRTTGATTLPINASVHKSIFMNLMAKACFNI
jgi:hypothetical protein